MHSEEPVIYEPAIQEPMTFEQPMPSGGGDDHDDDDDD